MMQVKREQLASLGRRPSDRSDTRPPVSVYLTDERTGELVRIPADRLEQYQRAQRSGPQPVGRKDTDRLMDKLKVL